MPTAKTATAGQGPIACTLTVNAVPSGTLWIGVRFVISTYSASGPPPDQTNSFVLAAQASAFSSVVGPPAGFQATCTGPCGSNQLMAGNYVPYQLVTQPQNSDQYSQPISGGAQGVGFNVSAPSASPPPANTVMVGP